MQTLLLPLHAKYSLFRAGCKKSPISKAEHVFHGTLSLSVPVQDLCKSCKAWGQHASLSSWHRTQEMRNAFGLQCVFISPTHIFSLLRRCYEWLCSWECPMWVCAVLHTSKPTRSVERFPFPSALLASVWLICWQCSQRQGSLSYSAESVKKLFQKTMKIFFIYSSSHECWCFSVLYFTIRFHQVFSAFPCHPGDSSAWTCTQRKNIATCNSQ